MVSRKAGHRNASVGWPSRLMYDKIMMTLLERLGFPLCSGYAYNFRWFNFQPARHPAMDFSLIR